MSRSAERGNDARRAVAMDARMEMRAAARFMAAGA
jgi:hypothetical protein